MRAALFRFVDVVPACRSLDDLARHLSGFLEEVRRPPAVAAGRDAHVGVQGGAPGPGRRRGGRGQAHGPPLHRRRDAARGHRRARGPLAQAASRRASTCSARRPSPPAEADRYAARCGEALDGLVEVYRKLPERPRSRPTAPGASRARTCRSRSPRSRRCCAPTRPSSASATPRCACAPLLRRARELDAHLHIDMESFDSREAVTDLVLELLSEDEFRDGPSAGARAAGLPARQPRAVRADRRLGAGDAARLPAAGAPGQGRLLGPRDRRGPPARLAVAGVRGQGRLRSQLRGAHAAPARGAAGGARRRSPRTTCARSPTPSPSTARWAPTTRDLELQVLRGLGDDLQEALAKRGLRVRTYCPVGDLVAGMAYLVRRLLENTSNESFLHEQAAGRSLDELLAAP